MNPRAPEKRIQACWDWITPDDVVRHALAAYYGSGKSFVDLANPFMVNGTPSARRDDFLDLVLCRFADRLVDQAQTSGVNVGTLYLNRIATLNGPAGDACPRNAQANGPATPLHRLERVRGVEVGEPVQSVVKPLSTGVSITSEGGA